TSTNEHHRHSTTTIKSLPSEHNTSYNGRKRVIQARDGINGGKVRGLLQNAYKGHKRGLYEGTGYSGYIRGTADTYGVQRIHTGYSGYIRGTADTYGVQRIHTAYSGYIRPTADTYGLQRIHTGYSVQQAAPAPAGRHTAGPAGRAPRITA